MCDDACWSGGLFGRAKEGLLSFLWICLCRWTFLDSMRFAFFLATASNGIAGYIQVGIQEGRTVSEPSTAIDALPGFGDSGSEQPNFAESLPN